MPMSKSKSLWTGALGFGAVAALLVLGTARVEAETETKPDSNKRACVDLGNSSNRRVVGPNQVLIEDGTGRSALITLSQPCSRLDEMDMIGFETYSSSLCDKRDMKILHSRNGETPLTCIITNLKLMNREETKSFEANEKAATRAG
jgi:hypothetical protein